MTFDEFLKNNYGDDASTLTSQSVTEEEPIIMIDSKFRQIRIPRQLQIIAVTDDHRAERVYFEIPRYFDDNDLFEKQLIIRYINPNNEYGEYIVDDKQLVTIPDTSTTPFNYIKFSWLIENGATTYRGNLRFSVQFQIVTTSIEYQWQTLPARFIIKSGIKATGAAVCPTDSTYIQLKNIIETYDSKIEEIKTYIDDSLKETIASMQTSLDEIKDQVNTIAVKVNADSDRISVLETKVEAIETNVSDIKDVVVSNTTAINELNTKVDTIATKSDTMQSSIDTINTNITDINTTLTSMDTRISEIETEGIDQIKSDVETLQNDVSTINGEIATIQEDVKTNADHIKIIEGEGTIPADVAAMIVKINERLDDLEENDVHYTDD